MATMIPSDGPREFLPESREDVVWDVLADKDKLPNDYYVIHSMHLLSADEDGMLHEGEGDFVIFHPQKGIMVIEAKAGKDISYTDGKWYYGSGHLMHHGDGPYVQARKTVHKLEGVFYDRGLKRLLDKTKIHSAVWFIDLKRQKFAGLDLPAETGPDDRTRSITLLKEDLKGPQAAIDRIFSLGTSGKEETTLSDREAAIVFRKVISPTFNIVVSLADIERDNQERRFLRLLDGQKKVLDFISDEGYVAIQGLSGTGKTLVATEEARRMAEDGKRVLFLCFNALLRDELENTLADVSEVKVQTLAAFCQELAGGMESKYHPALCERLADYEQDGDFPYDCVIIDEAQDFGFEGLVEFGFFETLRAITAARGGSLFVFYDPNQRVQATALPPALLEADTRLTLRVNCRNTREIALCSQSAVGLEMPARYLEMSVDGELPRMCFSPQDGKAAVELVRAEISRMRKAGAKKIAVLSCTNGRYPSMTEQDAGVPVYTARRFKGLEADGIVLIDVDASSWLDDNNLVAEPGGLVYVGASRAKRFLSIVTTMDRDECGLVVVHGFGESAGENPMQQLADLLGAEVVEPVVDQPSLFK